MEFQDVLRRRRMVRHFTDEPVADEIVEEILAAALRAPSAGYSQGYALLVLREPGDRARFWASQPPTEQGAWEPAVRAAIMRATVLVAVLASKDTYLDRYAQPDKGWTDRDESRWPVPYWYVDAGFLALLMLLASVDLGLGALLFGLIPEDIPAFRAEFGVPDGYDPIGCVAIGHEDPAAPRRDLRPRRRPAEELVHRGSW
ncbi:MAG TPA: nitroreductase family protein [Acidimicrobiales bacterium]|nr:nitroreductase family protein [Acidimicrobiales bacterium]